MYKLHIEPMQDGFRFRVLVPGHHDHGPCAAFQRGLDGDAQERLVAPFGENLKLLRIAKWCETPLAFKTGSQPSE